jgi:hypothetical protein
MRDPMHDFFQHMQEGAVNMGSLAARVAIIAG